jgi:hypothetical protein
MMETMMKKAVAFATIVKISLTCVMRSPDAMGTRIATSASDPMSSSTADVMIRMAAGDVVNPSARNETIVSETAVAVMASPHINEM